MPPPNLLFLYTDEQRWDTLGAYGNGRIETPNLDRLAARSTLFEQAYVTQPVCTPSRSSLLTGLYPHATGLTENNIPLPRNVRCLPEMLEGGDYVCAHHGKWHLGDEIFAQHGFTEWRATEDTYHAYYAPDRDQAERSAYHHYLIARGYEPDPVDLPPEIASRFFRRQLARLPEEDSRPAFLGREASRFIRENRDRPWVLYVNFLEPHMPFHGCRDGQYDPAEVTVPANFEFPSPEVHTLHACLAAQRYLREGFEGDPLPDEAGWRDLISWYWGLVSLVDTHVGRVLDTLRECGLDERTIVVFTSDHGDLMAGHRLLGKGHMFEESSRVPLLVRRPGQTEGRRVAGPVSQIDLVPTLLDLMGRPVPGHLHGRSLRSALQGGDGRLAKDVFIEWTHAAKWDRLDARGQPAAANLPPYAAEVGPVERVRASCADDIRTVVTPDGWKLNWSRIGEHELYHLAEDPLESRNLARDPSERGRIGDLVARIRAWQERAGDPLNLPDVA